MAVDDSWTDDPFLDPNSNNKKVDPKSTGENSTDIFGSSGSGQSSTRTRRGGGASVSGNTETTGTATVRIIRPPTEAGAAPKHERKTTLNNGSIIELVEAGFSDGTIIRRIEQSPVEFDFSANGVAELHKHRVSEKVGSAMKAAMGDDLNRSKTAPASDGTPKPEYIIHLSASEIQTGVLRTSVLVFCSVLLRTARRLATFKYRDGKSLPASQASTAS